MLPDHLLSGQHVLLAVPLVLPSQTLTLQPLLLAFSLLPQRSPTLHLLVQCSCLSLPSPGPIAIPQSPISP